MILVLRFKKFLMCFTGEFKTVFYFHRNGIGPLNSSSGDHISEIKLTNEKSYIIYMHILKSYVAKQTVYHSLKRNSIRKLITSYYYGKNVSGNPRILTSALQTQETATETKEAHKTAEL